MQTHEKPLAAMPQVDLAELERLKKQSFDGLLAQRRWILEEHAHQVRMLETERDQRLLENYGKMITLGIPEEDLPLPPENQEDKDKRLNERVMVRKLSDSEIRRGLRELMHPNEEYTSAQLIQHLEISYKDWMQFCKSNIPSFLKSEGKGPRWITYKIA